MVFHERFSDTFTGERGMDFAFNEQLLCVPMDINFPGIDGIEATKRIRGAEAHRDIPISTLTAHAMTRDSARIVEAGCNGYIETPIDP